MRGGFVVNQHVRGRHAGTVMLGGKCSQVVIQRWLATVEALAIVKRAIQALNNQHDSVPVQTTFHGLLQLGVGLERLVQCVEKAARFCRRQGDG